MFHYGWWWEEIGVVGVISLWVANSSSWFLSLIGDGVGGLKFSADEE